MRASAALIFAALLATSLAALIVSASAADGAAAADDEAPVVAGARIITCAGCRLNSLPRVRKFIEEDARSYPALHVEYQHGRDPEIQMLDKHRRVVSSHDLAVMTPLQITQLLNSNGIHTWTAAPEYAPPEFHETKYCSAFRQTAECNPLGRREPALDSPCLTFIEEGRSGYCQCKGGRPNVELACGHAADTCERMCDPDGEAEPSEPPAPEPPSDADL